MSHQVDHGEIDHRFAAGCQHFVVLAQSSVSTKPAEGPLHHPSSGQHHETHDIIAALDNLQHPAAYALRPIDQFPRVAAIRPDQFQSRVQAPQLAEDEFGSVSVLNVRSMNGDRQDQAEDVNNNMPLATVDLLARVVPSRPPFSVVFTLWLSTMAAEGDTLRPAATRTLSRRAS